MKRKLFTLLIISCISSQIIAQEKQQQSIGQISSMFTIRANTTDTIRFASIGLIVDSLEEDKEFVFETLRNDDLTGLGTMANVTGGNYAGYRLTPGGEHFAKKAAVIEIEYDLMKIPTGYSPEDIHTFFYDEQRKKWTALNRLAVDTARQIIISETTHFTDFINGIVKEPEMPEQAAFTPTMMNDVKMPSPFAGIPMVQAPQANNQGSAVIQYPIDIPAGRNGMQPSLGLTYSSESGNGILGVGWSMPQMAICVSSKWGVPRYDAVFESDQYLLDGTELTTFKPDGSADTLMQNTNVRKLRTTADSTLFRERKNENFNRIVRYGNTPKDYYWMVTNRNGIQYRFGMKLDSLKMDTMSVLRSREGNIAYWALTEIEDQYGNNVRYYYSRPEGNLYIQLDSINYTGFGDERGSYTISYVYTNREDIQTNGRYGFLTSCNKKVCRIDIFNRNQFLNTYGFEYTDPSYDNRWKTTLNEIKKFDYIPKEKLHHNSQHSQYGCRDLFNTDLIYSSTKFVYETVPDTIFENNSNNIDTIEISEDQSKGVNIGAGINIGYGTDISSNTLTVNGGYSYGGTEGVSDKMLIDMDGDGLVDYCYAEGENVYYRKQSVHNGISTFSAPILINGMSAEMLPHRTSKSDAGSIGVSFVAYLNGNFPVCRDYSDIYFSDVNSDGLPDIVSNGQVVFNKLDNAGHPTFNGQTFFNETGNTVVRTTDDCKKIIYDGEVDRHIMCDTIYKKVGHVREPVKIECLKNDTNKYLLKKNGDGYDVYDLNDFIYHCDDDINDTIVEAVKVWIAPKSGYITINDSVRLIKNTTYSRKQSIGADGIKFYIQLNNNTFDSISIGENDTANTSGTYNLTVNKNDKLFFRLASKRSNAFDNIVSEQTIKYAGDSETYSSSNDYVCNGDIYFTAIAKGDATVRIRIKNRLTPGNDTLKVRYNNLDTFSVDLAMIANDTLTILR